LAGHWLRSSKKKILVLVCEDFFLIGINYDSIQEIKFNYGKLGRHVAKKKIQGPCSQLKRIQISKTQKSELKKKKEFKK